jgi:hypothetical protein
MTHNWSKTMTIKIEDDQKFQKIYTKDIINGYVYVLKISYCLKIYMPYNIGVAKLVSTWQWSDPHVPFGKGAKGPNPPLDLHIMKDRAHPDMKQ